MDKNLEQLKPHGLWKHFAAICAIPHPSYHEEAIREYVKNFAKEKGIECVEDEAHNVILRKGATPGMEHCKGIILQAHLDMVPQKNSDKDFDFEKDGIEALIDGGWVRANGTTLGADNGIGVAAALTVFESDSLVHGPLEALFTATEESGMEGAFGLKPGLLNGKVLLNLDSETEGELYVGCAGGMDANIEWPYSEAGAPASGYRAMQLEIKGLKGGHSGLEIILERANANKLMARILQELTAHGTLLSSVDGGGLRNAIPREAFAVVLVPEDKAKEAEKAVSELTEVIVEEYKGVEDAISIALKPSDMPSKVFAAGGQKRLLDLIYAIPNGIVRMSTSMKGLVQTSTNLARVVSDGGTVKMQCLMRSSSRSEKEHLGAVMSSVVELAGGHITLAGSYDGWTPDLRSPILKVMSDGYEALYGQIPAVRGIHAGLECGIIAGSYPGLDMISFGPTICFPHSPDEKVNIESVDKFWVFLCHTLANAPR